MNDKFASQIITHLANHGVRKACISPGARSSPLVAAAAREPRLEKLVHFDERGAAFHAYGYAKGSKSPVVVITTSGSAAGNLFPAIMEAAHDHVPLIILTADRPVELQDCMANQTCEQTDLFRGYVRWSHDIPTYESQLSDAWLASTIAHAVYRATLSPPGPVHLNCRLREPFFTGQSVHAAPSTFYEQSHPLLSQSSIQKWAEKLSSCKKGVIIGGALASCRNKQAIFQLAEKLDWPVLPDLMSGLRSEFAHPALIPYFVDILKHVKEFNPDCILHLGDRLISKSLMNWVEKSSPSTYLVVADHPSRYDPLHKVTHRIMTDPSLFCEQLFPHLHYHSSWMSEWKALSHLIEGHIDDVISSLTEPGLIRYLHHHLPSHYSIYFSNSMPVRDSDRLFFPHHHKGLIFGQRGVSGIDGNIATAIGLAEGVRRPLVAVMGDVATLHDLNSLAQLKNTRQPVILLVINNGGGGIFSFLPLGDQKDIFEEYIAGQHSWNFSKAAEMFQIPYTSLQSYEELHKALRHEKTAFIEFRSDRASNVKIHENLDQKIQEIIEHLGVALR